MPNTARTRHELPVAVVLERFLAARGPTMTARRVREYAELGEQLGEYLARYRLTSLPCDPAFGVAPGSLDATALDQAHREQRAAIDGFLELADDFGDRYLSHQGVERRTLRLAEALIRDLGRWLRTTRLAPAAAQGARAPHLAVVGEGRARASTRGRRRGAQAQAQAQA
ncbi:MAG: hypothetical protein R3A79_16715 [Nannocystaceae bacterium]